MPVSPGRSHLSSDTRINTARALIEIQRYAEALAILAPLVPDHPDQTDVRFLIGLASSRGAQAPGLEDEQRLALLDQAIAAFRSILIRRPELVRVRLELALAFYLKEDDQLAREHFERALVGRPPAALVANVNRFLNIMRGRRRWRGYFGFSLAPDTNINAASDAEFIYINGLPFRRGAAGRASSDIGIVGWGGGEYQFPWPNAGACARGSTSTTGNIRGSRFDQTYAGIYVGPRWLISRNTEMSLLATASQRWFGQYSFNYDYGARLEVEHRVLRGPAAERPGLVERPQIPAAEVPGRAAHGVLPGRVSYVPFPIVGVNALVGYQQQEAVFSPVEQCRVLDAGGHERGVAMGLYRGAERRVPVDGLRGRSWFPFTTDGSAREDHTRILQATLLNRAITVFGFSPQVAFSNQVRESNAQLWDFKRNLVEMRWVRQF